MYLAKGSNVQHLKYLSVPRDKNLAHSIYYYIMCVVKWRDCVDYYLVDILGHGSARVCCVECYYQNTQFLRNAKTKMVNIARGLEADRIEQVGIFTLLSRTELSEA